MFCGPFLMKIHRFQSTPPEAVARGPPPPTGLPGSGQAEAQYFAGFGWNDYYRKVDQVLNKKSDFEAVWKSDPELPTE